jgi:hypothetical protein
VIGISDQLGVSMHFEDIGRPKVKRSVSQV